MMYDVRVLNHYGVWVTDTTARLNRAKDRARFLIPRVAHVQVLDRFGSRVAL